MKLVPLNGKVCVKKEDSDTITKGGLILPDIAKKEKAIGVVVSKAEDTSDEIKIGDKVVYSKFAGHSVRYNEEDYLFIEEQDIHAKLN